MMTKQSPKAASRDGYGIASNEIQTRMPLPLGLWAQMARSLTSKARLGQLRTRLWQGSSRVAIYKWLPLVVQSVWETFSPPKGVWLMIDFFRHGPFRRIRQSSGEWRSSSTAHRLQHDWFDVVLHLPRAGWVGCAVPRGRIILRVLHSFSRSGMGFRDGMELLPSMADYVTAWGCCCGNHGKVLELASFPSCMGCSLSGFDNRHKFLRS